MTQVQSRFIPKFLAWLKEISSANETSASVQSKPAEQPKQAAKAEATEATKAADAMEAVKAAKAAEGIVEVAEAAEAIVEVAETVKPAEAAEAEEVEDDKLAGQAENREVRSIGKWQVPPAVREKEGDVLFQDFPLDPRILRAILEDLQFTKCTPIQGMVLPHALAGDDIAGRAQTGTGKTAAFLITMLYHFLSRPHAPREPNQPFALALAPTRELAIQIAHDANALCAYCHFNTVAVYGGMDYDRQRRLLHSNVDLVVATPGRLIDYLGNHVVNLDRVEVLVIDEADRMLDMGFIPDVKRIIYRLGPPEGRQTMLFSATLNHDIMNLASRWMRPNPAVLEAEPEHVVADGVDETIYAVTSAEKMPVLLWTLRHEDAHRVLIFRNRRRDVEELHAELQRCGITSEMLSGDVDQKKRLRILEDFKTGKTQVIVATDVAGRGIHVDDVTHVINYDFPYEAEDYVHRVGRTARAGHRGRAISFADEESAFVVPDIEKYISRPLPITQPSDEMLQWPEDLKVKPAAAKPSSKPSKGRSSSGGSYRGGRVRRGGPRR
ncbi:MAG: DEAD/DEAH box helicase [Victivallales bacterium]|nr:DEAD/DEAH box helicase [Victivallales bacterium]